MGLAGRGLAGHVRIGTCYEYRHPVDEAWLGLGGALRGRSPRTREGRLGPTAQTAVVSGQWSEGVLILVGTGMGADQGLSASRGIGEFAAICGMHLNGHGKLVQGRVHLYRSRFRRFGRNEALSAFQRVEPGELVAKCDDVAEHEHCRSVNLSQFHRSGQPGHC